MKPVLIIEHCLDGLKPLNESAGVKKGDYIWSLEAERYLLAQAKQI